MDLYVDITPYSFQFGPVHYSVDRHSVCLIIQQREKQGSRSTQVSHHPAEGTVKQYSQQYSYNNSHRLTPMVRNLFVRDRSLFMGGGGRDFEGGPLFLASRRWGGRIYWQRRFLKSPRNPIFYVFYTFWAKIRIKKHAFWAKIRLNKWIYMIQVASGEGFFL